MVPLRPSFRSPAHYALACATEVLSPVLSLYARSRCPGRPAPPANWRTALLLGADHIGDLLYLTPSLPALKAAFPACEFLLPAPEPARSVLEGNPHVTLLPVPSSARDRTAALKAALAGRPVDACLCYNSGRYGPDLKVALDLAIPARVGYVHKGFSAWVTRPAPIRFQQPYAAYFRDFVAALAGRPADWPLRPQVFPSAADEEAAAALRERLELGGGPVIACFPFTRQPTPTWSPADYARALKSAGARTGARPLLMGAPEDGPRLAAAAKEAGLDAPLLAGALPLRALVPFLKTCDLVFTNDSGPRHLAHAAGAPVAFIRNLWPRRIETGPYVETETDLAPAVECLGGEAARQALAGLTVEAVAERLAARVNGSRSPRP